MAVVNCVLLHFAGNLHAATGQIARAEEEFEQALSGLRSGPLTTYVPLCGAVAWLRLAAGRITDALAITDQPAEVIARKGTWLWATDIAPVRVCGDVHPGGGDVRLERTVAAWAAG